MFFVGLFLDFLLKFALLRQNAVILIRDQNERRPIQLYKTFRNGGGGSKWPLIEAISANISKKVGKRRTKNIFEKLYACRGPDIYNLSSAYTIFRKYFSFFFSLLFCQCLPRLRQLGATLNAHEIIK